MLRFIITIFIFLSFALPLRADDKERDDAFLVKVFDQSIKVISPPKHRPFLSIIVENNTLVTVLGKVQTASGQVIGFLSVKPGTFLSLPLRVKENDRVFFIPLAPAFQEVELLVGNKTYEIPPKR